MSANPADIVSVEDVTALRKLWPGTNTDLVSIWLQGSTAFNVSPGMLTWQPASNEADNGTTVVNPTGNAGLGRWISNSSSGATSTTYTPQQFGAFADGTLHAITAQDITDNPQWVNRPDGTPWAVGDSWDTVAFMQCIYACYASTSPAGGSPIWNNTVNIELNKTMYVPIGLYYINRQLELTARGIELNFQARESTMLQWYGDSNVTMLLCDSLSYAVVRNFSAECMVPTSVPLVSLDHTGAHATLKTQQITFYDMMLRGNFQGYAGIDISASGGAAQGDTVFFVNPLWTSFLHHAYGSFGGNAVCNGIFGGDMQFNSRYGCYVASGQLSTSYMHGENQYYYLNFTPAYSQIPLGGADFYINGPTGNSSTISGFRSEAEVSLVGDAATNIADNVWTLDVSNQPWYEDYPYIYGFPISGTTVNSPFNYKTYAIVDDGSSGANYIWYKPTSITTNTITLAGASWSVNQWQGLCCFYRYSNGFAAHLRILSNTSDTLTVDADPGGLTPGVTMFHIGGYTETLPANAPDFDTCPQGYSTQPGQTGGGFTMTAGSPVLTVSAANYALINVGDYVYLPALDTVGPGVAGYVDFPTCWIAKVLSKVGVTVTVNRNAPVSQTDVQGYWGGTLLDNQVRWMELDWDCMRNVQNANACGARGGRLRNVYNITGGFNSFRTDYNRYTGTWTPIIRDATAVNAAMSSASGWFELLGSETVVAHGEVKTSSVVPCSGSMVVSLPFISNSNQRSSGCIGQKDGLTNTAGYTQVTLETRPGQPEAFIIEMGSGVPSQFMQKTQFNNVSSLRFSITYRRSL